MPGLQAIADELAPKGLRFVTVMMDGTPAAARVFARREGLHAPVVLGSWALLRAFRVSAYPSIVIFDPHGKPLYAIRGGRDRAELRRTIRRFLR